MAFRQLLHLVWKSLQSKTRGQELGEGENWGTDGVGAVTPRQTSCKKAPSVINVCRTDSSMDSPIRPFQIRIFPPPIGFARETASNFMFSFAVRSVTATGRWAVNRRRGIGGVSFPFQSHLEVPPVMGILPSLGSCARGWLFPGPDIDFLS